MDARAEEVIAEHNDGDIDQIVGDKYRSEQLFFVRQKCSDALV